MNRAGNGSEESESVCPLVGGWCADREHGANLRVEREGWRQRRDAASRGDLIAIRSPLRIPAVEIHRKLIYLLFGCCAAKSQI